MIAPLLLPFSCKLPGVDLGLFPIKKGRCHFIGNLKDAFTFSFFLSYGVGVKQLLAFFEPNVVAITDA